MPSKTTRGTKRPRAHDDGVLPASKKSRPNTQTAGPCPLPRPVILTPLTPQRSFFRAAQPVTSSSQSSSSFTFEPHPTKQNVSIISLVPDNDTEDSVSAPVADTSYECDKRGYIKFKANLLIGKYRMLKQLGKGTFSRVFECKSERTRYAVKVIRNTYKYQCAAHTELSILKKIAENDPNNTSCCIHLLDHARFHGHPVMVFPLLKQSIYQFMSGNGHKPFSYADSIDIMYQICSGVAYMHSLSIINTDLKPENMVLLDDRLDTSKRYYELYSSPKSTAIRLIDFGSAVMAYDNAHDHLIQTRHYRAPEVIFKLHWSFPADVWSVGCILAELVAGRMLFHTHCSIDHLNQIVKCIGGPPQSLLEHVEDLVWNEYFDGKGALNMRNATVSRIQCGKLKTYFGDRKYSQECAGLYDLCKKMLCWDPEKRITAQQCLQHDVFERYRTAK